MQIGIFRTECLKHFDVKVPSTYSASTAEITSSSAHQSGDSLGVAATGEIAIACLSLAAISIMLGLFLGSL